MKHVLKYCFVVCVSMACKFIYAQELKTVTYQTRDSNNNIITRQERIDPAKVGIVVIDMWNWHWCKTSAARVACMVPRMNKCLEGARRMGMQVFLCPTDVANNYVGTPQREKALAVKKLPLPPSLNLACPHPGGGGCMCGPDNCIGNYGWDGMAESLLIHDQDLISSGPEELYALCKEKGITHLWYMGVHTNNCVLGKPEGMRNMMNYGFTCALVRDLQDPETFYDPVKNITPDDNNARVVAHFEKYLAPSVNFASFLAENKAWNKAWVVDPVRITPWGKPERAHQFTDKQIVTITTPLNKNASVYYTLDGSQPGVHSIRYSAPFEITATTTVRALAFEHGKPITIESIGYFTKIPATPPAPDVFINELALNTAKIEERKPVLNQSVLETPLSIHGVKYEKGVGTQSPSFLTYTIKAEYEEFVAQCGVDDYIRDRNFGREKAKFPSVQFKVFIDGKLVGESPLMRNSHCPWSFRIAIPKGSRGINLVVTDGGDGNRYDYADWVNTGFLVTKANR
ncbi:MAG: NPCBM/NEW2 domain-containing protein [Chitinophagaceae bacterium]|nr:NPCBM/NEW2 domain-containing protein [Chitinophagaceae bacterium]